MSIAPCQCNCCKKRNSQFFASLLNGNDMKIGESVKMRNIVTTQARSVCTVHESRCSVELHLSPRDFTFLKDAHRDTEVTLSFEIPVPERKVQIAKSEMDSAFREYYSVSNRPENIHYFITEKFFKEES